MDWQGVPYKFLNDTADSINLAVTSVPKIILDSQPDYTSPVITGVVSVIAGLIPALIAFYTFKRNSVILKSEREAQQGFLITERKEQQEFLKNERDLHIFSTEKDRETQLAIAKRNFDVQVFSANRQDWINRLRDLLADYMSFAPSLLTAMHNLLLRDGAFKKISVISNNHKNLNHGDKIRVDYDYALSELSKATDVLVEYKQKEKLLTTKIKLMINPSDKWYFEIIKCFNEITMVYSGLKIVEVDDYMERSAEILKIIDRLLKSSQGLLKYEWERVKKGI
ncbi:hypothetical protein [Pectobacterium brasiliense]|uniref:hypothetical protein n=1 Tax=Pectobacterium brasiliense TaxID=180957 RepID=UPI003872EF61